MDKQKENLQKKDKTVKSKQSKTIKKTATQDVNKKETAKKTKPPKAKQKKLRIVFVCTGNTCRSPMAEQLFKDYLKKQKKLSFYEVLSAGLMADEDCNINSFAAYALTEMGIKAVQQKSRQLTPLIAEKADMIVCMTEGHKRAIEGHSHVFSIAFLTGGTDVPDPYGCDKQRYVAVARYLQYACADIFTAAERLRKQGE